jgi:hypothetical protein
MNKTFLAGYKGSITYHGAGFSYFDYSYKVPVTINAGLTADFPLNNKLSWETGLIMNTIKKDISVKYSSYSMSRNTYIEYTGTGNINLVAINIPLAIKYSIPLGKDKFSCLFGPCVNAAIFGKENGSAIHMGNNNNSSIRRFDLGMTGGLSVSFGNFEFAITGELGLRNLWPQNYGTIHSRGYGFSMGLALPKKKTV